MEELNMNQIPKKEEDEPITKLEDREGGDGETNRIEENPEAVSGENPEPVSEEAKQENINEARKKLSETYMKNEDVEEWKERIGKEKFIHGAESKMAFLGEGFWKKRGEAIAKNSRISEAIGSINKEDIILVDVGSGKQHINKAIMEANPEKNIKVIGFDQSDKATKKASFAGGKKVIESAYGIGEALPVKNESADVVKFDFTFQGASEEKRKTMLEEAKSILKKDGIITVIDHLAQENPSDDKKARMQNALLNKGLSEFDEEAKNQKEWEKIFTENGLIVERATPYREDGEVSDEKPAQYISFVLKKAEVEGKIKSEQ